MKRFKAGDVVVITKPPYRNWPSAQKYRPELLELLVGEIGVIELVYPSETDIVLCSHSTDVLGIKKLHILHILNKYIKKIGVL